LAQDKYDVSISLSLTKHLIISVINTQIKYTRYVMKSNITYIPVYMVLLLLEISMKRKTKHTNLEAN